MRASQDGDANYVAARPVDRTFLVLPAQPQITWNNPAPISFGTALSAVQLDATCNLAGTFVFNPPLGTLLNAGASQRLEARFTPADTRNYSTATATVFVDVAKANQTISFPNPGTKNYEDRSFGLNATASSGLPVQLTIAAGDGLLSPGTFNITAAGPVTVRALQPGNANYNPAPAIEQSFEIRPAALPPTATFATFSPTDNTFTMHWQVRAGGHYRLERKENLEDTTWLDLGQYTASDSILTTADPSPGVNKGFYRLRQLE